MDNATNKNVRVRFAPSPTGKMHLGNVRAALINTLFAQQKNGTFILRIEDTDAERLVDPDGKQILADLNWLGMAFNEGPFFQSQRALFYQEAFEKLLEKKLVYPCFETPEELEAIRKEQAAQGLPPRYNRAALTLSTEEIQIKLDNQIPFIWRFKLPEGIITINDVARGPITYDMNHFADFALTRQDGTFTFIFANFVDDMLMRITHVFRGEDHVSNSANQAALYQAFDVKIPEFYHLPLICNSEGKKLSKRDFGFSLSDLKKSGFLPEAICNYLAIIGGSYNPEIMDLATLIHKIHFNNSSPTGTIHYDVEKLRWINQKWISSLNIDNLVQRALPFLQEAYPDITKLLLEQLTDMIERIQTDMVTLHDAVERLAFFFAQPECDQTVLELHKLEDYRDFFTELISIYTTKEIDPLEFFITVKTLSKTQNKPLKDVFTLLRLALTGQPQGLSIKDLVAILGSTETSKRLNILG
jgi:glutamyl-tRNA synthetase